MERAFNILAFVFFSISEDFLAVPVELAVGEFPFVVAPVGVGKSAFTMEFVILEATDIEHAVRGGERAMPVEPAA